MADFYKILKADKLGAPWESHGHDNQTFWCQVEGQDKAVSISKQVPTELHPGQFVYGELMYAKSQKGTEYWKLKSVQVPEGVQRPTDEPFASPASAPSQAPVDSSVMPAWFAEFKEQLNNIEDAIIEVHNVVVEGRKPMPADFGKVATDPSQLDVSDGTKAVLDDMFNEPEPEV